MFRIAMPPAKKHPKLSSDERAFLNRLDRLNEEKIKQFTTREIFAYFKIIDKVDSRADVRQWWNARSEIGRCWTRAVPCRSWRMDGSDRYCGPSRGSCRPGVLGERRARSSV